MKKNTVNITVIVYVVIFVVITFIAEFGEIISLYYEEGNGITDYARITDVEYSAKLIDEPGSKRKSNCNRKINL